MSRVYQMLQRMTRVSAVYSLATVAYTNSKCLCEGTTPRQGIPTNKATTSIIRQQQQQQQSRSDSKSDNDSADNDVERNSDGNDNDDNDDNEKEFDIYLEHVTKPDLLFLFQASQKGLNVWPWIWTQPNPNGPHHVFVLQEKIAEYELSQIRNIKQSIPNVNILVITTTECINNLPDGVSTLYNEECGVVLDTEVELTDFKNKMIMLKDERIINYSFLYAS